MEKGEWSYNPVLAEMQTAREWGLLPSEWWAASEEDRALMFTTQRAEALMQAWNAQQATRDAKRRQNHARASRPGGRSR